MVLLSALDKASLSFDPSLKIRSKMFNHLFFWSHLKEGEIFFIHIQPHFFHAFIGHLLGKFSFLHLHTIMEGLYFHCNLSDYQWTKIPTKQMQFSLYVLCFIKARDIALNLVLRKMIVKNHFYTTFEFPLAWLHLCVIFV